MKNKTILLVASALVLTMAGPSSAETGQAISNTFSLNTGALIGVEDDGAVPSVHHLAQCYPNPFNPSTTIKYSLANSGKVHLTIYDLKGRLVRSLIPGLETEAGPHEALWRGRNDAGRSMAGGVYLCRMKIDGLTFNQRMTLIK